MKWKELDQAGYKLSIGKRSWTLFYQLNPPSRIEIARGKKRSGTSRFAVFTRAYPYATADFVKRRVNGKLFIDSTLRESEKKKLMEWFTMRIDKGVYDLISGR